MGKVNVYLPADLERAVREAGLSISPVCQAALQEALDALASAAGGEPLHATARLRRVLRGARRRAASRGREVSVDALFDGIVRDHHSSGARALLRLGVDLPEPYPAGSDAGFREAPIDTEARSVLRDAVGVALDMRRRVVGTGHLLVAIAEGGSPAAGALAALGVDAARLRRGVEALPAEDGAPPPAMPGGAGTDDLLARLESAVELLSDQLESLRARR